MDKQNLIYFHYTKMQLDKIKLSDAIPQTGLCYFIGKRNSGKSVLLQNACLALNINDYEIRGIYAYYNFSGIAPYSDYFLKMDKLDLNQLENLSTEISSFRSNFMRDQLACAIISQEWSEMPRGIVNIIGEYVIRPIKKSLIILEDNVVTYLGNHFLVPRNAILNESLCFVTLDSMKELNRLNENVQVVFWRISLSMRELKDFWTKFPGPFKRFVDFEIEVQRLDNPWTFICAKRQPDGQFYLSWCLENNLGARRP